MNECYECMNLYSTGICGRNKIKQLFPSTENVRPHSHGHTSNRTLSVLEHSVWIHPSLHRYACCDVISTHISAVVLTPPKNDKRGHHMAEAVCRLSLSAVDRVRSQSDPCTQWHCDRSHSISLSAVKINPRVLHTLSHTDTNAIWFQQQTASQTVRLYKGHKCEVSNCNPSFPCQFRNTEIYNKKHELAPNQEGSSRMVGSHTFS